MGKALRPVESMRSLFQHDLWQPARLYQLPGQRAIASSDINPHLTNRSLIFQRLQEDVRQGGLIPHRYEASNRIKHLYIQLSMRPQFHRELLSTLRAGAADV